MPVNKGDTEKGQHYQSVCSSSFSYSLKLFQTCINSRFLTDADFQTVSYFDIL